MELRLLHDQVGVRRRIEPIEASTEPILSHGSINAAVDQRSHGVLDHGDGDSASNGVHRSR